jgi:hypothetical protein
MMNFVDVGRIADTVIHIINSLSKSGQEDILHLMTR